MSSIKSNLRNVAIGSGLVLIVGLFYLLPGYLSLVKYKKDARKVVLIEIYQEEAISELEEIVFSICDSTYSFGVNEIRDTIFDNYLISDKRFLCAVHVLYKFNNGSEVHHEVDSFNCSGCSGINRYILTESSIEYEYLP